MEKVTLDSLSELVSEGHEVHLFSMHPVGDLKILAEKRGIALSGTAKYRFMGLGNIREVRQASARFQPDRIWLVGHNFGSLVAACLLRRPVFLSIHYHHSERSLSFWRCFYGFAKRCCSGIHFVSQYIFGEVASLFSGYDGVHCFPNVLPEPEASISRDEARGLLDLGEGEFVVGNAGWLIPRKAFDVFLQTAALIHKVVPEAVFLIAGDGSERNRLEQLAVDLGIARSVRFVGWQSDLSAFYSAVDVLLFNSHFDCLPTTPLEAMVRGIPVVCSLSNGGLEEVLRHKVDGFLIDSHDTRALADEVCRLYADKSSAMELARQGRERVLDVCSRQRHIKHLNDYLELS